MTAPDGSSMVHSLKTGDMRWDHPNATHTLTNRGTKRGVLVEIEPKQAAEPALAAPPHSHSVVSSSRKRL